MAFNVVPRHLKESASAPESAHLCGRALKKHTIPGTYLAFFT